VGKTFDVGIGISDCAAVVCDDERNAHFADFGALDLAQLVCRLLLGDAMADPSALDVVEHAQVFVGFLDGDDVHESRGVSGIGAGLAVDLDLARLDDRGDVLPRNGVMQFVAQQNDKRQALAELVRAGRRARRPFPRHLV
jgi:hypothetical protein